MPVKVFLNKMGEVALINPNYRATVSLFKHDRRDQKVELLPRVRATSKSGTKEKRLESILETVTAKAKREKWEEQIFLSRMV